jgi:predicted metalloprotease with PDZ domain
LHFNHYFGEQWQPNFDIINSGGQIQWSPTAFFPKAQIKQSTVSAPDYHFNIQKFLEEDIIADLAPNSAEYKAGLRNGQKVIDFDAFLFNTKKRKITIVVEENSKMKDIKFIPRTKITKVPQYQLVKLD